MHLTDLPTPAVLIEHARLERNIERMQAAADRRGLRLRPHAKTHKSPRVAKMQMDRGAIGICCAKLGEAEVFADAGIEDIRLPYPLHPVNAPRVLALMDRVRLSFIIDHADVARGWSETMSRAGRTVDVLVKVDVGARRCGIIPGPGAADFVARVAVLPGLRLRGLLSHAGQAYGARSAGQLQAIAREEAETLTALAAEAARLGVELPEISVGATPTALFSAEQEGLTEIRPGNYVYYDRTQVSLGAAGWDDCALTVLSRVVSRPAEDRLVLDAGSKVLTNDPARGTADTAGYGTIFSSFGHATPDGALQIDRLSEEHATVRISGHSALHPGDLVRIVPNHSCVVSNLVDAAWLVGGESVVDRLEISARGRIT